MLHNSGDGKHNSRPSHASAKWCFPLRRNHTAGILPFSIFSCHVACCSAEYLSRARDAEMEWSESRSIVLERDDGGYLVAEVLVLERL